MTINDSITQCETSKAKCETSHSSAEKAVIVLFALERAKSINIIQRLSDRENCEIARVAARMGNIDGGTIAVTLSEFREQCRREAGFHAGQEAALALLTQALPPERRSAIGANEVGAPRETIWSVLRKLPPARIAAYLQREASGVCANVLRRMSPSDASKVLREMDSDARIKAISDLVQPAPRNVQSDAAVEQALVEEFGAETSESSWDARIAEFSTIINALEPHEIPEMVEFIARHDPEIAHALRSHVFTFDDLLELQAPSLARVLDRVSPDKVVVALHDVTRDVREVLLAALPVRTRRLVESEIDNGSTPATRDVHLARAEVARTALEMLKSGEIMKSA